MNLGLVTHRYSRVGGTEKYVVDLSRWLVCRGHEVTVYCVGTDIPPSEQAGVNVRVEDHLGRRGLVGTLSWLWTSRGLGLADHDVVQGFGRTIHHDVFRAGGGVHEIWLTRRYAGWERVLVWGSARAWVDQWVDRRAFDNAKIVICNSEMVAREVHRVRGIPMGRLRVVRNGVDIERFQPNDGFKAVIRDRLGVSADGRVVMFVGNGFRRKGLMTAGKAFADSCGANDVFVVIGKESRSSWYERRLQSVIGERLRFIGSVEDTSTWLPAADALLLPTLYDPAANVTLEALACGVAPIVSRFDGNHEIVPFPELVVKDPDDVKGFSCSLRWALERGIALREDLLRVAQSWPVSRNGELMESVYREIASGSHA